MIKLFLVIGAMLLMGPLALAQVKVSVLACPQFNEAFGVRIGSNFDIPLNSRWSLVPGAYWSFRNRSSYEYHEYSTNNEVSKKDYHFYDKAHFLTLPIRMGVRLAGKSEGKFSMKLLFGPYLAYGIKGSSECKIVENGIEEQRETGAFDPQGRYRTRWDYGLNSELYVLLQQHLHFGFFTEIGCRKIYNANTVIEDIWGEIYLVNKINVALGLSLGYQF